MQSGDRAASESTLIVLVRHGEAANNAEGRFGGHGPAPLTEVGRKQAEVTAAAVERLEPTAVISSDLVRAVQTAEPIVGRTALTCVYDERFRERSVGVFDNLLFSEAEQRYPDLWQRMMRRDFAATPPGGETVEQVFQRVSEGLDEVVEQYRGGRVLIVSHGLAIYHALSHIFGLGVPTREHKVFALVGNCSLSTFKTRAGRWRIKAINDCSHLSELG